MPPYNASDPAATFLSWSCLDLLLIELVPLAYRVTAERGDGPARRTTAPVEAGDAAAAAPPGAAPTPHQVEEEEELDAVHFRLEALGYRVGQGLVERCGPRPGRCARLPAVH